METLRLLAAVATVFISVAALAKATFLGNVMKADGDGGSNSGGDSGGWDFSNDDLPF